MAQEVDLFGPEDTFVMAEGRDQWSGGVQGPDAGGASVLRW